MKLSWTSADNTPLHASLREGAVTVAHGRDGVHTFDGHGRWIGGSGHGRWWRRGLDGRCVGGPRGDPAARPLAPAQAQAGHAEALALAASAAATLTRSSAAADAMAAALAKAVAWDCVAAQADAAAFAALYAGPIPIVPGDLPRAIYLQATRGCAWNRCSYCSLYHDLPFAATDVAAFDRHVGAVLAWFGGGLPLRRTVFLGDADLLVAGPDAALGWLAVLDRHVERAPRGLSSQQARAWQPRERPGIWEVHAFASAQSVVQCLPADLETLAAAGVGRLYLGLETADPQLRKRLRRPESLATMAEAVARLKAAGLQVALMVIAGLGGRLASQQHTAQTAAFIGGLGLDSEDLVSLSPLIDESGQAGTSQAVGDADRFDAAQVLAQVEDLRRALDGQGPRVAPYDLAGFVP